MNLNVFAPEIVIAIFIGLVVVWLTWLKPLLEKTAFFKTHLLFLAELETVIGNVVVSIAFAPGDLSKYQDEATAKGWDIRLVAAVHIVDSWAATYGINLDEQYVVSVIEAKLALYKSSGTIPRASPLTPEPIPASEPTGEPVPEHLTASEYAVTPELAPLPGHIFR